MDKNTPTTAAVHYHRPYCSCEECLEKSQQFDQEVMQQLIEQDILIAVSYELAGGDQAALKQIYWQEIVNDPSMDALYNQLYTRRK